MEKKIQKSGKESVNYQAETIEIKNGLTYAEVKEVALDVFRDNFFNLSEKAMNTANERAMEITEIILEKLSRENPNGLSEVENPDFQADIFTVQKEYAKSGDMDLGELLTDILVDRSKRPNRDILQIVLNESLSVAPKLTRGQIAALGMIFIFRYTKNDGIGNADHLGNYLDKYVSFLINDAYITFSSFQHLQYTGCGSIEMSSINLEKIFLKTYKGLFQKGVSPKDIADCKLSEAVQQLSLMPCFNSDLQQVNALSDNNLNELLKRESVDERESEQVKKLFNMNIMNEMEVRKYCEDIRPYCSKLFECWNDSSMKKFSLTSVGIAIGHASIKRFAGEFSDLKIWIN